ncbi:1-aminocyclopropane-1-carboxylate deaminase/D-cysteine desulfhydrase [Zhouia amylolytica]|uniref:DcyD protein n=1 Tax=Zhouia amylolytica AD3 TaxID=1286632 RepID=W2UID4_9FLAO|nr:pyridoxal-phosphate dependent enzyme [Zhouia amylolytica]ETN93925.1 DcyD protein [Zhouia amylolytica AD3]
MISIHNEKALLSICREKDIELVVKREDLIHPFISGNKYRKLKYNLSEAKNKGYNTILTFGGAYSNHIAATAYAAKEYGFKSVGVIRGEELEKEVPDNPTLSFAKDCGMHFDFVSRTAYRNKNIPEFQAELSAKYGKCYLVPEGGTNQLAVKGCEEILTEEDAEFDYIGVSVGTGGTISGIINSASPNQKVLGFPALKGDFLKNEILKFVHKENWSLVADYHFGGYAKVKPELIEFINEFKRETKIPLDPVYTGKMLYGLVDMIKNDKFEPNTKILVIHTGGLQGIAGMNQRLKQKKLPLIDV